MKAKKAFNFLAELNKQEEIIATLAVELERVKEELNNKNHALLNYAPLVAKLQSNLTAAQSRLAQATEYWTVTWENLKCCGNCKFSKDSWEGTLCDYLKQAIHCGDYRDCWQSDGMTRKQREVKG
jgi:hypothetical protein